LRKMRKLSEKTEKELIFIFYSLGEHGINKRVFVHLLNDEAVKALLSKRGLNYALILLKCQI
jgi:hypothetical protein